MNIHCQYIQANKRKIQPLITNCRMFVGCGLAPPNRIGRRVIRSLGSAASGASELSRCAANQSMH